LSAFIAPWKTIEISRQRYRRVGLRGEIDPVQAHRTADDPRIAGQEPDERQRGRGLAAAGLAGDTERLAGVETEAHPVDRPDGVAPEGEVRPEVIDLEERRPGHGLLRERARPPLPCRPG
jgi:hypothetical protein